MAEVVVGGIRIHYERAGQGPALLLLHGIGSNSRSWRYQLAGLSDGFTVVAWDAPGYGRSSDPPEGFRMADYADCLAGGLLDNLGLERVYLAGLSWGGVLAQEFYRRYPERVFALVLADTVPGRGAMPEEEKRKYLEFRSRSIEGTTPTEMARRRAPAVLSPSASPDLVAAVESIMAEIHPRGYLQAAAAIVEADTSDLLPRIAVPTLVLCGEMDTVTPPQEVRRLRDAIPDSRFVLIPGAGHLSNQERPELFNALVREFVERGMQS